MVKAIGIDPGTMSMDIYGFDDHTGEVLIDISIPRDKITENPSIVLDKLRKIQQQHGRIDAIVGACGYGMPLKPAREATDSDIAMATFVSPSDAKRKLKIIGLRELMKLMRGAHDLNIWFTPGAVHLETIPQYRKANRIDLGTADKIYSVILAVKNQAERLNIPYAETCLILVEIGYAYTSALAVKNGKIVDAMAGTAAFPSYLGAGFLDSELAYALANCVDDFSKLLLFSGGAAHVAGVNPARTSVEEFVSQADKNPQVKSGYELMLESIVKDIAVLLPSVMPREVVLSGRFIRIPKFFNDVKTKICEFFRNLGLNISVIKLKRSARVSKEAAEGAAIFANGIAGGIYRELIETMELRKCSGDIFSHVYFGEEIRRRLELFKKLL